MKYFIIDCLIFVVGFFWYVLLFIALLPFALLTVLVMQTQDASVSITHKNLYHD